MVSLRPVTALLLACAIGLPSSAAQMQVQTQAPASAAQPAASEELAAKRKWALDRIRALGGEIAALRDDEAKIRGLARLAAQVCAEDKDMARDFLRQAYALSGPFQKAGPSQLPPVIPPAIASTFSVGIGASGSTVWGQLMSQTARCDPDLAFEFNQKREKEEEPLSPELHAQTDLSLANELAAREPEKAVEFARRAISTAPTDQVTMGLVLFLRRLRETDEQQATTLFLSTLQSMAAELRASSSRLLTLGNYLFGAAAETGGDTSGFVTATLTIGSVRVLSIMANRPQVTPELARAYLETSLSILSRPVNDPDLKKLDYAAAYQMRAKAKEFAPHLEPLFTGLMQQLSSQVPEETPQQTSRLDAPLRVVNPMDAGADFEKMDPRFRRAMLPMVLTTLVMQGRAERLRELARELEDTKARDIFLELADFVEAESRLQSGDTQRARELLANLKMQLPRALLAAGLAVRLEQDGDTRRAAELLSWALRDAELIEGRIRPPLLLVIAGASATLEPDSALTLLEQAVAGINRGDGAPDPGSGMRTTSRVNPSERAPTSPYFLYARGGFSAQVHVNEGQASVRLAVRGANNVDFTPALMKKFGAQAERAHAIVGALSDESRRAEALASVAAAYLESIPKAAKAQAAQPR